MTKKSVTWDRDTNRPDKLGGGFFVEGGVLHVWVEDDYYNGSVAAADLPALLELVREAMGQTREPYEPPAIVSTVQLSPIAAAMAAAQLTPEQIEERRRIGEERAPKRTEAVKQWMKRSLEHAAELCIACKHARGVHTPDCEECDDCERFEERQ